MTTLEALRIFGPLTLRQLADRLGTGMDEAGDRLRKLLGNHHAEIVAERPIPKSRLKVGIYDITRQGRLEYEFQRIEARAYVAVALATPQHFAGGKRS